jgi:hypothetical protein
MCDGFTIRLLCRLCLWALLTLLPYSGQADNNWTYHQENDRLTNLSYSFARSPMPRTDLYDDLRLDVACKEKKLQVILEADVLIASQGSEFEVEFQIDKQSPVKLKMRTFPDSKRKGYTEEQAKSLADALLSGQAVFIRVNTMIRRVLSGEMPLSEAGTPIKQVYADCGLLAENANTASYSLANFTEAFGKLTLPQQREVLDMLKKIMTTFH